jgi:hypothetical protein
MASVETPDIRGQERVDLIEALALGAESHVQLAERFGRSPDAIHQFSSRNKAAIAIAEPQEVQQLDMAAGPDQPGPPATGSTRNPSAFLFAHLLRPVFGPVRLQSPGGPDGVPQLPGFRPSLRRPRSSPRSSSGNNRFEP